MARYLKRMANIIALLFGLVAFVINIGGILPLLGWVNWLSLPFSIIGIVIGQMAAGSKWGRNICIAVALFSVVRLFLGGGII